MVKLTLAHLFLLFAAHLNGQSIGSFTSVVPNSQTPQFICPSNTHSFQVLIEKGSPINGGNYMPDRFDFTGYIPNSGSSESGKLCINAELNPDGFVTILNADFNTSLQKWAVTDPTLVNFASVEGTRNNCSGGLTPWGTLVTCEENQSSSSLNSIGYKRYGWCVEVNPITKAPVDYPGGLPNGDKIWKAGIGNHENACFNANERTMYTGLDLGNGVLYKFVADVAQNLSEGKLYALKRTTGGNGYWTRVPNHTIDWCNNSHTKAIAQGASTFMGIEDVEIGPDGKIYFAVKNEQSVYRFQDNDPLCQTDSTISGFETFVGGAGVSYTFATNNGMSSAAWGTGNDNLAFDDGGNLWVLQDGSFNYIWVVENGHTQSSPKVKLFGIAPLDAEPTGITFTPDYKYLFMSFQHPNSGNNANQLDAFGVERDFNQDVAIVISRKEFMSNSALPVEWSYFEAKKTGKTATLYWETALELQSDFFKIERMNDESKWETIGEITAAGNSNTPLSYSFEDKKPNKNINYYRIAQVSQDGKTQYSNINSVTFNASFEPINPIISPNPAKDYLQCSLQLQDIQPETMLNYQLINPLGQIVLSKNTIIGDFNGFYVGDLPKGNYWLIIKSSTATFKPVEITIE
jgi:uncharacterized protein